VANITPKHVIRWILGTIITAMFGVAVVVILTGEDKNMQLLMAGALIGAFTTVVGYYFGSSEG
jgi:hypothetical protein